MEEGGGMSRGGRGKMRALSREGGARWGRAGRL